MPIDRSTEHKTAVRIPDATAEGLKTLSKKTRISQNDLMAEACKFLVDLAESEDGSIPLPEAVVQAHAVREHARRPKLYYLHPGSGPALLAAETPEKYGDKRRPA